MSEIRVWRLAMRSQVYADKQPPIPGCFDWISSGDFVTLADYRALEQRNQALEQENKTLRDELELWW